MIEVDPSKVAPNPDNPRIIDEKSADFITLRDSIAAAGVVVPIAVRAVFTGSRTPWPFQLIAGSRRLAAARAAGVAMIPAHDYGELADDLAFEITVAENFCRRDLTPIEGGRAVSTLLARFGDDAAAVAARMGQTPHWVATHAQIERGLSPDWKKEAATNSRFTTWSAAHWIPICRLAPALQAKACKHFCGSACYGAEHYSVANVEEHLSAERRLLKDAPFVSAGCADCVKRTGHAPLLWAASVPEASGKHDRCLDPKCWDKKVVGAIRAEFDEKVTQHNYPAIVPLEQSTAERYGDEAAYKARQARSKAFGKSLLQAADVTIVTEKTPGAQPALVVGGRGKGALKWVKKDEAAAGGTGGRAGSDKAAEAKQKARDAAEKKVGQAVMADLCQRAYAAVGPDKALLAAVLLLQRGPALQTKEIKALTANLESGEKVVDELIGMHWQAVTDTLKNQSKSMWFGHYGYTSLIPAAALFGFDLPAMVAPLIAVERTAAKEAAKKAPKKAKPGVPVGSCRVCGCTDEDCSGCIAKTGSPCNWVELDLCSACATPMQIKESHAPAPKEPKKTKPKKASVKKAKKAKPAKKAKSKVSGKSARRFFGIPTSYGP